MGFLRDFSAYDSAHIPQKPGKSALKLSETAWLPRPLGMAKQALAVVSDSHTDHLTREQLDWIVERFAGRDSFFIESVEMPTYLGTLRCGLHGPAMGDEPIPESEVRYEVRGDRDGASRICDRAPRPTRIVTVIAGPHDGQPCVLYTAFAGTGRAARAVGARGGPGSQPRRLHVARPDRVPRVLVDARALKKIAAQSIHPSDTATLDGLQDDRRTTMRPRIR